jgi:hypothetical protein
VSRELKEVWSSQGDDCELKLSSGKVVKVKYQPFMGVMGVAPPPGMELEVGKPLGVIGTGPPNINGGNMDNRHLWCENAHSFVSLRFFFSVQYDHLPRQARDKRKENSKKKNDWSPCFRFASALAQRFFIQLRSRARCSPAETATLPRATEKSQALPSKLVRKHLVLRHFYPETRIFAKTGSEQTNIGVGKVERKGHAWSGLQVCT